MSGAAVDPRLLERANFPHIIAERIRFRDIDMLGHVNNAAYSTYSETARTLLLMSGPAPRLPSAHAYVIVRTLINFRRELSWPGTIDIATGVTGIGRSSFSMAQAVFDGAHCSATFENVIVVMDQKAGKSAPVPEDVRAWLAGLALRG